MTAFGKAEGSPVAAAINAAWMLGVCWITWHTVACQWVTGFGQTTVSPHNCLFMFDYESCTNADFDEFSHKRFYCSQNSYVVFVGYTGIPYTKVRLFKATLALADAGIPMRDLVVACTAGM